MIAQEPNLFEVCGISFVRPSPLAQAYSQILAVAQGVSTQPVELRLTVDDGKRGAILLDGVGLTETAYNWVPPDERWQL